MIKKMVMLIVYKISPKTYSNKFIIFNYKLLMNKIVKDANFQIKSLIIYQ